EDEAAHARRPARLEEPERPGDVDGLVECRILLRGPDSGARRQVDDQIGLFPDDDLDGRADVALVEPEAARGQVAPLDRGVVVVVEVVDDRDVVAAGDKPFEQMGPDEARASCQENLHEITEYCTTETRSPQRISGSEDTAQVFSVISVPLW